MHCLRVTRRQEAEGDENTLLIVTADHETGGHTHTHVPVTAMGAGAEALRGINDNTLVFEVMLGFLGISQGAQ